MFTEHISHGKKAFSLVFMACLIAGAMIFGSCALGYDPGSAPLGETVSTARSLDQAVPSNLEGIWRYNYTNEIDSGYELYTITTVSGDTQIVYEMYDTGGAALTSYGYTATVVSVANYSYTGTGVPLEDPDPNNPNDDSYNYGVIIIQYDEPPAWAADAPYYVEAGWYDVVYYNYLNTTVSPNTIKLANGVNLNNYAPSATDSLVTAQYNFTWDNDSDYVFNWNFGSQIKQP
jgi:hypothetical protein